MTHTENGPENPALACGAHAPTFLAMANCPTCVSRTVSGHHDIDLAHSAALVDEGWRQRAAEVEAEAHPAEGCKWFALCENPATTTRSAPWGEVPICERCAAKVDRLR